jgi:hypothetical protein
LREALVAEEGLAVKGTVSLDGQEGVTPGLGWSREPCSSLYRLLGEDQDEWDAPAAHLK